SGTRPRPGAAAPGTPRPGRARTRGTRLRSCPTVTTDRTGAQGHGPTGAHAGALPCAGEMADFGHIGSVPVRTMPVDRSPPVSDWIRGSPEAIPYRPPPFG